MNNTILLLANKTDLKDERKVSEEEGKKYAKRFGMTYKEISILESNQNQI